MGFDMEGMLDSAKDKVVDEATEKFGQGAAPVAEKVAGKMEQEVANKLGVTLHDDATDSKAADDNQTDKSSSEADGDTNNQGS
jgi:hypothetical protein